MRGMWRKFLREMCDMLWKHLWYTHLATSILTVLCVYHHTLFGENIRRFQNLQTNKSEEATLLFFLI